jgi:hypothetical protein
MGVFGVKTTIPYYQEILLNPQFRTGRFNTSFVESHPELTQLCRTPAAGNAGKPPFRRDCRASGHLIHARRIG